MQSRRHSPAVRWRLGIAGLAVVGCAVLAVPTLAEALPGSGPDGGHGQPPPGAPAVEIAKVPAQGTQPPAGASTAKVGKLPPLGVQPAGPNVRPGPSTQVRGPREKASPRNGHVSRRLDKGGVNGADQPGGRSDR